MNIVVLRNCPSVSSKASLWFSSKWNVPLQAYEESIKQSINNPTQIPQWYVVLDGQQIVAGAGVIENDFHHRKDLKPNLCALFVEKEYRNSGIAKKLLEFICCDVARLGFEKLYLITEHTNFYEKCNWKFLTMVQEYNGDMTRMYYKNLLH